MFSTPNYTIVHPRCQVEAVETRPEDRSPPQLPPVVTLPVVYALISHHVGSDNIH